MLEKKGFAAHEVIKLAEIDRSHILANIADFKGVAIDDADLSIFTDLAGVSAANLTAIETAIGAGLLSADGMSGGIFDPNGVTTRGQAAQIQMNLLIVLGKLN